MPAQVAVFVQRLLEHSALLRNFFTKRNYTRDDVDDLCQETYLRVLTTYADQAVHDPKGLLFKTARNLLTDIARRERLIRTNTDRYAHTEFSTIDHLNPERHTLAKEDAKALTVALAKLPMRRRQVLWMKKVDNLAIKDIATQLNIAPHTVEQHIRKAMHHTRNQTAA